MVSVILEYLKALNNSKFFAGLVMIMLNIGSKYVTIELSKNQEEYLLLEVDGSEKPGAFEFSFIVNIYFS